MKTIKLIVKGILLYITLISIALFIGAIDIIIDYGYLSYSLIICLLLVYFCIKFISEKELETLILAKFFKINLDDE